MKARRHQPIPGDAVGVHDPKALEAYVSLLIGDRCRTIERNMEHRLREVEKSWADEKRIMSERIDALSSENTELQHSLADMYMQVQSTRGHTPSSPSAIRVSREKESSGRGNESSSKLSDAPRQSFVKIEKRVEQLEKLCRALVGEEENFDLLHRRIDQTEQALRLLVEEMDSGMRQVLAQADSGGGGVPNKVLRFQRQSSGIKAEVESILAFSIAGPTPSGSAAGAPLSEDILGGESFAPRSGSAFAPASRGGKTSTSITSASAASRRSAPTELSSPVGGSKVTKIMDSYIKNALDEKNQLTGELQRVREATKKATQDLETIRASVGQHDDALASLHRLLLRMEQEKQTGRGGVEEQKEGHSKALAEALAPIEAKVAKLEAAAGETPPLRRLQQKVEEVDTSLSALRKSVKETREMAEQRLSGKEARELEAAEAMAKLAAGLRQRVGTLEISGKRLEGSMASLTVTVTERVDRLKQETEAHLRKESQARVLLEKELHYYLAAMTGSGSMAATMQAQMQHGKGHGQGHIGQGHAPARPGGGPVNSTSKSPRLVQSHSSQPQGSIKLKPLDSHQAGGAGAHNNSTATAPSSSAMNAPMDGSDAGNFPTSPEWASSGSSPTQQTIQQGQQAFETLQLRMELKRRSEEAEHELTFRLKQQMDEVEAKLAEEKAQIQAEKERAVQRELELSLRRAAEAEAEKGRLEALAKEMEAVIANMKAAEAAKEIERLQAAAEREREKNQEILKAEAEAIERARQEVELREERRVFELTKELQRYRAEAESRERERELELEREEERRRQAQVEAERQQLIEKEKAQAKEAVAKHIAKFSADKQRAEEEARLALEAKERARLDAERELDRLRQRAEQDARQTQEQLEALRAEGKDAARREALKALTRLKSERGSDAVVTTAAGAGSGGGGGGGGLGGDDDDAARGDSPERISSPGGRPMSSRSKGGDTESQVPFLSAEDLADDPILAQLDQEIRIAKQAKVNSKRDIKKWLSQFEKDNGCPPDTRAKESVKHLYLAHHKALAQVDKAEEAMLEYLRSAK